MAVNLYSAVKGLVEKGADFLTEEMVVTAASNAPMDTGNLSGHIKKIKVGFAEYIITTDSRGKNGVEYPAKIETGESVSGYQHFWYQGNEIKTRKVKGSSKPNFMKNTVSKYGGH